MFQFYQLKSLRAVYISFQHAVKLLSNLENTLNVKLEKKRKVGISLIYMRNTVLNSDEEYYLLGIFLANPPWELFRHVIREWLLSRLLLFLTLYLVVGILLLKIDVKEAIGLIIVCSFIFWSRPSIRHLQRKGYWLRYKWKECVRPIYVIAFIIQLLAMVLLYFLKNIPHWFVQDIFISSHIILIVVIINLLVNLKISYVHKILYWYPLSLMILTPTLSYFINLSVEFRLFNIVLALLWFIIFLRIWNGDPNIDKCRISYEEAKIENIENIITARERCEHYLRRQNLIPDRPLYIIDRKEQLLMCTPIKGRSYSFCIVDIKRLKIMKTTENDLKRILGLLYYLTKRKRGLFDWLTSFLIFITSPVLDSYIEHHEEWARNGKRVYKWSFVKEKWRELLLLYADIWHLWKAVNNFVHEIKICPHVCTYERFLERISSIKKRLFDRSRKLSGKKERQIALKYLQMTNSLQQQLKKLATEIEIVPPESP